MESDAANVPQVVACEVYPYDRSRSGRHSAAPGANNNFSDSLSQAAESELQSINIGVESAGQTGAQIPLVMRTSAFSPYPTAILQDPNIIRPYHTTFVPAAAQPAGQDQQLLKPIPQRVVDAVYGVSPMFLSGVGAPQQFAYPSAAVQIPMPALYSDVSPQDPRALQLAHQLQQQQMQGSMHAATPGLQSFASGQQVALPLHVVPVMAAAAANNVQQFPVCSSATDTLNQSHLYAYCFGTNAQPNQQFQMEAMATPPAVSQLRSEHGLRSATASPTRTLPPRDRVYGIVKGSRV